MTRIRIFTKILLPFWPPLTVVLIHSICTGVFGHQRWLDPLLHFVGGSAILFSVHRLLEVPPFRAALRLPTRPMAAFLLVFALVILWEVGEFLSDHLMGTHVQQGIFDTLPDIFLGLAGASGLLVILERRRKRIETLTA